MLSAVLVCCCALVSCKTKKTKMAVGFAQEGDENAWRIAETQSVQAEAARRETDLHLASAQGDVEKQIGAVRTFIAQRVDAIILAPKVETGWTPVLKEAKDANIPVILIDRGVSASPDLYATLIESDFVEEGRRAAQWLAEHTRGQEVNIVELEGSAGSAPAIDRKKGFDEQIKASPKLHILASQDGNFTREGGKQVMTNFLLTLGAERINAVYCHNDDMALGAIQAIEAAGKKPGHDIKILSIDGIHDGIQAVLDKKINCIVECNPLLGSDAFDAIEAILLDHKTLPKKMTEKDALFDESNVTKELLDSRKY